MATNDPNYRDPKVTTTASSSGTSKWIAYVIGGLILLALLAWLLGLFDNDVETTTVPTDDDGRDHHRSSRKRLATIVTVDRPLPVVFGPPAGFSPVDLPFFPDDRRDWEDAACSTRF